MRAASVSSVAAALVWLFVAGCTDAPHGERSSAPSAFAEADSLRMEGRSTAAGAHYLTLRDSFALRRDTASWWRAQLWLADALLKQGHRDSAEVALAAAAALAAPDSDRIGWTRYVRSIFLDRIGRFDSALVEAGAAQSLAHRLGDRQLEASSFSAMGRIHSLSGQYGAALTSNQQAIALERSYGASAREIAKELNELGIDYRHLGRFTDAVAVYDSSLRISRRLGNPESIARVEYNLGEIRRETGDPDEALVLFTDALGRAEQIGEVRGMAFIHGGLAELYASAGARTEARHHLERALELNKAAKLIYGQLQNLEALGRLEIAEQHPAAADSILQTALAMADSGHYGKERSTIRSALARAAAASRRGAAARRWSSKAVQIADSLGDPEPEAEARAARGVALEASHDPGASAAYIDAIDLLESWRGRLALGDLRMGVAEPHLDIYEGAIRTLLAAGRQLDAFHVGERARARLLLELMAERDIGIGQRSRDEGQRQKLRELFSARADAAVGSVAQIDREIRRLTDALDSMETNARARDARAGMRYPVPARADELRTGLLPNGQGLIVFFWGEKSVYGWWLTKNTVHSARLGSVDSLAATVDFMRGALARADGPDWKLPARRAYMELIAPLRTTASSEILVVSDGPLATMPLEALIPKGSALPWGAEASFVYGPSASVLWSLQKGHSAPYWSREVLAVGDPKAPAFRGAGTTRGESDLPPLPNAAGEARSIGKLLGGDVLIGADATLANWLALDPGRYRYLHFATHALVSDRHPQETALVLADGKLDLPAIRRLRLSSDLVTLSACETGLGQRIRGEGTVGLPHAFLSAGARSVVVSLWRVDDRATADYMADFYRELRGGLSPAAAMLAVRRAKLGNGGAASHPSQWAPFILVGMPQSPNVTGRGQRELQ